MLADDVNQRNQFGVKGWTTLFVVIAFTFSLAIFFPGWMSPDSVSQLSQGRSWDFGDWHPPLMAAWWGILDRLVAGPVLMLLQNLLFYWCAVYLIITKLKINTPIVALGLVVLFASPTYLLILGEIWKDTQFGSVSMLIFAIIFTSKNSGIRTGLWVSVLAFFLMVYAVGVKPNGIVIVPVLALLSLQSFSPNSLVNRLRFVVSLFITLAVGFLSNLVSTGLNPTKQFAFQYTQLYDLLALSVRNHTSFLPTYVQNAMGGQSPDALYMIGSNNPLAIGIPGVLSQDGDVAAYLSQRWIVHIFENFDIYLEHRFLNFLSLLRVGERWSAYVATPGSVPNQLGVEESPTVFGSMLSGVVFTAPYLFFPWVPLVISSFVLAIKIIRRKLNSFAFSAWSMGTLFLIPHFFIAPASDYRYLYCSVLFWTISCVIDFFGVRSPSVSGRIQGNEVHVAQWRNKWAGKRSVKNVFETSFRTQNERSYGSEKFRQLNC